MDKPIITGLVHNPKQPVWFVAAQLRAELAASSNDPRLYHVREEQGLRKVDPAYRDSQRAADRDRDQGRRHC
jgi:hypothetical protein